MTLPDSQPMQITSIIPVIHEGQAWNVEPATGRSWQFITPDSDVGMSESAVGAGMLESTAGARTDTVGTETEALVAAQALIMANVCRLSIFDNYFSDRPARNYDPIKSHRHLLTGYPGSLLLRG